MRTPAIQLGSGIILKVPFNQGQEGSASQLEEVDITQMSHREDPQSKRWTNRRQQGEEEK